MKEEDIQQVIDGTIQAQVSGNKMHKTLVAMLRQFGIFQQP